MSISAARSPPRCSANSSLAVAIGYPDLVSIANTTINQTGQVIEGIAIIMLVYLTISLAISGFMNWYNRRFTLRGASYEPGDRRNFVRIGSPLPWLRARLFSTCKVFNP